MELGAVQRNVNLVDIENVAKIGVDTTDNEPPEVSRKWGFQSSLDRCHVTSCYCI